MTRPRIVILAAMAVALGGCSNPREEARAELRRLREAVEQHAKEYGRYPDTVDPGRPASATNLAHQPPSGVTIRLVHAGADGFQAVAHRRPWVCSLNVDARGAEKMECAPLNSPVSDGSAPTRSPASPFDSVPRSPSPVETRP
jgi:hypothetical protein